MEKKFLTQKLLMLGGSFFLFCGCNPEQKAESTKKDISANPEVKQEVVVSETAPTATPESSFTTLGETKEEVAPAQDGSNKAVSVEATEQKAVSVEATEQKTEPCASQVSDKKEEIVQNDESPVAVAKKKVESTEDSDDGDEDESQDGDPSDDSTSFNSLPKDPQQETVPNTVTDLAPQATK